MDRSREGRGGSPGGGAGAARSASPEGTGKKPRGGVPGGQPSFDAGAHPVLLFDGDCGLCAGSVQFVHRRDPEGLFRFAPLDSPIGRALVERAGTGAAGDTLVLLEGDRVLIRSRAVRAILLRLPGWRWAGRLLGWIPAPVGDLGYRLVAAVRRRLFPPPRSCPLPDPRIRSRILGS